MGTLFIYTDPEMIYKVLYSITCRNLKGYTNSLESIKSYVMKVYNKEHSQKSGIVNI